MTENIGRVCETLHRVQGETECDAEFITEEMLFVWDGVVSQKLVYFGGIWGHLITFWL